VSRVAAVVLWLLSGLARAEAPLPVRIDELMEARRFAEARPLVERWCAELERSAGPEAVLAHARARHVLGSVQDRLGDHVAAAATLERALALYAQAGAGAAEQAAGLDEAGRAAQAAGQFTLAATRLRAAAEARADQPALAAGSRAQLADVLVKLGRLEEAGHELELAAAQAGDDPAARWQVDRQRGVLAQTAGRHAEALGWFDRALGWAGRLGEDGPPLRASLEGQRGQALFRLGRAAAAARALQAAADFFRPRADASEEWLAHENNLAAVWLADGGADRARDRLRSLLASPAAVALGDSPALITPWLNARAAEWAGGNREQAARALDQAARLAERTLPAVHPLRAQVALARLAAAREAGDPATARAEARRASEQARAWLGRLGDSVDESQWLEFRRTLDPISPLAVVGADEPEALADAVLATQGRGLERMLAGPGAAAPPRPSWRELAATLPPGAVLVNYVWWRPLPADGLWAEHGNYGALVLRHGQRPVWTDLGPAAAVEARVRRVIAAARDTVTGNRAARNRASLDFQLARLWDLVWARLAPQVQGASSILLRPDGMLHFVPWAILREGGEAEGASGAGAFCQRYPRVRVLARAARQDPRPVPASNHPVWRIVAVPEAPGRGAPGPPSEDETAPGPDVWRDLLVLPALPGVVREVEAIRAAAAPSIVLATPPGLEAGFSGGLAPAPAVLHFCGHGFASEQDDEWGVPQLESGLVFADCADGLVARAAGRRLPADRDGILFACEAAALNLDGTNLVVLSACQTGLGHWQPGEHLAGLRHAFIVAGARHVAATLWDVNDASAPEFIEAFYRRLAAGAAPDEALWSTQRAWLETPSGDPAVRAALAGAWTLEAAGW